MVITLNAIVWISDDCSDWKKVEIVLIKVGRGKKIIRMLKIFRVTIHVQMQYETIFTENI